MEDHEKEIARKYLLPERPFLHGMASAFDLFGVLGSDTLEQLADRQSEMSRTDDIEIEAIFREVEELLLLAMDHYDEADGES